MSNPEVVRSERFPLDMTWPLVARDAVASVSADQMRELDRVAMAFGLSLLQMMENAGLHLSEVAWTSLDLEPTARVTILAGGGNKGGGALVAARHLANRGADVTVVLDRGATELGDATRAQLELLKRMGVAVGFDPPRKPDAIIDGLIGYGLRGDPEGRTSRLIEWANASRMSACSLDLPSGLDASTGMLATPCLQASVTLTLALPKTGLLSPGAEAVTGTLLLADIAIPAKVYSSIGVARPDVFRTSPVVEISR